MPAKRAGRQTAVHMSTFHELYVDSIVHAGTQVVLLSRESAWTVPERCVVIVLAA